MQTNAIRVAMGLIIVTAVHGAEPPPFSQVAKPSGLAAEAPRYSDVGMRLFEAFEDGREFEAGKAFHITRAEWCYNRNTDYVAKARANGWVYQGSLNAWTKNEAQALKDKGGKPLAAWIDPKTKKATRWVADPENPEYRAWYVAEMVAWLDLGVDGLQRDEPSGWGRANPPLETMVSFFKDVHAKAFAEVGRRTAISCNLGWNGGRFGGKGAAITDCFDAGMSEYYEHSDSPGFILNAAQSARGARRALCFTGGCNLSLKQNRRAIAACYANGLRFLVPWDQFTGKDKPRYFPKPEEMADLFGFVRANADLLDGYEYAGVMCPKIGPDRETNDAGLKTEAGSGKLSAFVRARPGALRAPVVVHLVEWADDGRPAEVRIPLARLFDNAPVHVEFRLPAPYDAQTHAAAETAAASLRKPGERAGAGQVEGYGLLNKLQSIPFAVKDGQLVVSVPALSPWGMLVIKPEK